MALLFPSLLSLFLMCQVSANRVKDVLSDQDHLKDGHNAEFDHQAFLGKDQAAVFDQLSPEESKERLGKLFLRVDADGDGQVVRDELRKWIKHSHDRYIHAESVKQMKQSDLDKDGLVTWKEYKKATYGFIDEHESERETYENLIAKEEKRFKLADKEGDLKLKVDEWTAFLHPENYDHMKGILATETLQDIDKNKDGSITLEEYIDDVWPEKDRKGAEPDWVKNERKQFGDIHDKNKDGKMDKDEVDQWIIPPHYDHFTAEAEHLITESDSSGDGRISKKEMVDKYDLFVGSQATQFGEILKEEL